MSYHRNELDRKIRELDEHHGFLDIYYHVRHNANLPKLALDRMQAIVDCASDQMATVALNAAYSGEMSDGGASTIARELTAFLDGMAFAFDGTTNNPSYNRMIEQRAREADPDWQEYQRLKQKFEG